MAIDEPGHDLASFLPLFPPRWAEQVRYDDRTLEVDVDDAQRRALVEGEWDTTALMRANGPAVREVAASLPYVRDEQLPEA
jgi:3-isopropylmalate/(R)-2-methylmalate dehydratase small subunit